MTSVGKNFGHFAVGNSGDFSLKQRLSNYDGIPPEHYGCGYKLQQCSTRDVSVENGSRSIFSGMSGRRKPYVSPRLDPAWGRSLLLWKLCSSQLWSTLQLNVGVGYVTRVLLYASFKHLLWFFNNFQKHWEQNFLKHEIDCECILLFFCTKDLEVLFLQRTACNKVGWASPQGTKYFRKLLCISISQKGAWIWWENISSSHHMLTFIVFIAQQSTPCSPDFLWQQDTRVGSRHMDVRFEMRHLQSIMDI